MPAEMAGPRSTSRESGPSAVSHAPAPTLFAFMTTPAFASPENTPPAAWRPALGDWPAVAGLALVILALDALCLQGRQIGRDGFTMFLPSAGVALVALWRGGVRLWPGIFAGSLAAFLIGGLGLGNALSIALGETTQGVLGTLCLTHFRPTAWQMNRLRDWTRLMLFGALLAPLLGANLAAFGLLRHDAANVAYPIAWLTWWAGSALGVGVAAPLVLAWSDRLASDRPRGPWRAAVAWAWLTGTLIIGGSLFTQGPLSADIGNYVRGYLLIPLGIGGAILGGRRIATLFVAGFIGSAVLLSHGAPSLFGLTSPFFDQLHWWLFCAVLALTTQGLAVLLCERGQVIEALQRSQKRVADSEANLMSIAQAPSSLIWMSGQDGTLQWCNDVWLRFTGQSVHEVANNDWRQSIHPDDRAPTIRRYTEGFAQRQSFQLEFRLRNERGNYHRMLCNCAPRHDAQGHFLGYVGVCIDVTAEREASEQLRSQEQLIRGIYDHSDVGIAVISRDGRVLHHNARLVSLLGWTLEDYNALGYAAMLHPAERDVGVVGIRDLLLGTLAHLDVERRFLTKDGHEIWGQISCRPMYNPAGEQVGVVCTLVDISTRREAEQRLRLTAKVFEACTEGVMITDSGNRILEVNEAFTAITGYLPEEAIGQTPRLLSSGRHPAAFYATLWSTLAREGRWSGEIWNRRRDGSEFPEWLSISVVRDLDGSVSHHVAVFSDITERKQVEARIRQMAQYDFLTKLPNRALMYDRLRQIHATASRYDKRYAVIFVDLDNFKPINDQLGHDAGDALLCQVADRLKSNLRVMDTPARYGGDEFIVLVPEINDMHEVRIIAEKLSSALRQPYLIKHQTVSVTPSIGIALYPEHAQDPDDLIRVADAAMYNVKSSGRDGLAFYAASASTQLPN